MKRVLILLFIVLSIVAFAALTSCGGENNKFPTDRETNSQRTDSGDFTDGTDSDGKESSDEHFQSEQSISYEEEDSAEYTPIM